MRSLRNKLYQSREHGTHSVYAEDCDISVKQKDVGSLYPWVWVGMEYSPGLEYFGNFLVVKHNKTIPQKEDRILLPIMGTIVSIPNKILLIWELEHKVTNLKSLMVLGFRFRG